MVAAKILSLYSFVWEPILSNELTGHDIIQFAKKLPELRNALSCCVCSQLLTNREILCPTECRVHFVCKACQGKEREASKKCSLCEDWSSYEQDETLNTVVKSYQDFCYYFLTCEQVVRLLEVKHEIDPSFDTFKLIELVAEGLKGSSLGKKRKVALSAESQNRGVVPYNVPKKSKKIRVTETSSSCANCSKPPAPVKATSQAAPAEKTISGPNKERDQPAKFDAPPIITDKVTLGKVITKPVVTSGQQVGPVGPVSSVPAPAPPSSTKTHTVKSIIKVKIEPSGAIAPVTPTKTVAEKPPPEKESPRPGVRKASDPPSKDDPAKESLGAGKFIPKITAVTSMAPVSSTVPISVTSSPINVSSLPIKLTPSIIPPTSQGAPQIYQITHQGGLVARAVSIRPQQLRLAGNLTIQGRSVPVSVIGASATGTSPKASVANPIGSPISTNLPKRKIIVTTPDMQHQWPDATKVLQFTGPNMSSLSAFQQSTIRPSVIGVQAQSSIPGSGPRFITMNVKSTVPGPLVRPANTTTASSLMSGGTVPTTSFASGVSSISNHGQQSNPNPLQMQIPKPQSTPLGTVMRSESMPNASLQQVPVSTSTPNSTPVTTPKRKQEGCRCGNAGNGGKLTCIGQRCACYADGNACSDCKCKGCKNPYLPGSKGKKLLHGMRALLDPQANQTIPLVAGLTGPSSSTVLGNATVTSSNSPLVSTTVQPNFGPIHTGPSTISHSAPPIQLIPVRFGQTGAPQYIQITNAHALQQIPIILSSGHLQAASATGITIQGVPVSGLTAAGIHQVAQLHQQRPPQVNIKSERNPQGGS